MLQLEEARERILNVIEPLSSEVISLPDAAGRFAAQDIVAPLDLPLFDNSAMDGYAVRSEDLKSASSSQPVSLKIVAHVPAGPDVGEVEVIIGGGGGGGAPAIIVWPWSLL